MGVLSGFLDGVIKLSGAVSSLKKEDFDFNNGYVDFLRDKKGDSFVCGFSRDVILPEDIETKKYYIAGYGENNPARGVLDPQYIHAMWLDDCTDRGGILLISADCVGILGQDVQKLRNRLVDFCNKTGCRKIDVMCTHNHAGIDTMGIWGRLPFSGKNPDFMELIFEKAEKIAFEAYENRSKGDLYLGTIQVPDMQEDIRTPVVYSETLTRFRFVPENGNEIWLLNFASHSESLQGCNHLVSADFPCYLRERIRDKTGADVLYTVGAIGGMISMNVDNEKQLRKEHRLNESTRKIGFKLADYAMAITEEKKLEPIINFASKDFVVEVDNTVLALACLVGLLDGKRYPDRSSEKNWILKTEVSYYEIGTKKLLLLPCELFPELAFGGALDSDASATGKGAEVNPPLLCDITGDKEILIFGLANDEIGYVLPPNDFILNEKSPYLENGRDKFDRRHYEETNSVGPKTAAAIASAVSDLMELVKE